MYILKRNIPWKAIGDLKLETQISPENVYKTYRKLVSDNVLYECYNKTVDTYIENEFNDGIVHTDTTAIANKYGNENIGRNKYYKNKNISKLSLVTDTNGAILNVKLFSGNHNDAKIGVDHIQKLQKTEALVKHINKINTVVADPGYNASKIRAIMEQNGIACIIPKNKRNTKDPKKLEQQKLTKSEMITYIGRIKIENTNAIIKKCRRIDVRYDRLTKTYMGFVYAGCMYKIINYI